MRRLSEDCVYQSEDMRKQNDQTKQWNNRLKIDIEDLVEQDKRNVQTLEEKFRQEKDKLLEEKEEMKVELEREIKV